MNEAWSHLEPVKLEALQEAVRAGQACERATGVPCCISVSQWALESAWGTADCGGARNYFGIKADPRWKGPTVTRLTKEYSRLRGWYTVAAKFRAYPTMTASFADHGRFLRDNKRYARLFDLPTCAFRTWAKGLQDCGYATDPHYAEELSAIIVRYGLRDYNLAPEERSPR